MNIEDRRARQKEATNTNVTRLLSPVLCKQLHAKALKLGPPKSSGAYSGVMRASCNTKLLIGRKIHRSKSVQSRLSRARSARAPSNTPPWPPPSPFSPANMSSHDRLSESATFPSSDSENYDANHSNSQDSEEPTSSSSSPLILYSPPTIWSILRGAAINLFLPFINGLMLGFGELVAHETAWRLGWSGTKVSIIRKSRADGGPSAPRTLEELQRCRARQGCRFHIGAQTDTSALDLPFSSRCKNGGAWGGDARGPHRTETKKWRGDGCVHRTRVIHRPP